MAAALSTDLVVILSTERVLLAVLSVFLVLLHPAGRGFLPLLQHLQGEPGVMLAMVGVAAVPLLVFASTNIELQANVTDEHASMGHYGFIAFCFTVVGVGLLAGLRPAGWRHGLQACSRFYSESLRSFTRSARNSACLGL